MLLRFDALRFDPPAASAIAERLAGEAAVPAARAGALIEIPTIYDGPDLDDVAAASGLRRDEIVSLHSGRTYDAYFLGFMPGFAYLGRLDERIQARRLATPRAHVPAGSVAVADGQTAVYPLASPGGWRLIGRTEMRLFDSTREPPATIRAGDTVRFVAR